MYRTEGDGRERERSLSVKAQASVSENEVESAWSSWVHICSCSSCSLASLLSVSVLSCSYSIVCVRVHTFKTGWLMPVSPHPKLSPSKFHLVML